MDTSIVHLDGRDGDPLVPEMAGQQILIAVRVGYPGSRVSDILIGNEVVKVPNSELRAAYEIADAICCENFAGG